MSATRKLAMHSPEKRHPAGVLLIRAIGDRAGRAPVGNRGERRRNQRRSAPRPPSQSAAPARRRQTFSSCARVPLPEWMTPQGTSRRRELADRFPTKNRGPEGSQCTPPEGVTRRACSVSGLVGGAAGRDWRRPCPPFASPYRATGRKKPMLNPVPNTRVQSPEQAPRRQSRSSCSKLIAPREQPTGAYSHMKFSSDGERAFPREARAALS